jgi:[ribosomal protein S5]-alanine N-acetyltransferase
MTAPHELRTARLLLRSLEREDVPALVRLAGVREISSMTANIPHPYAEQDGQDFLARASEEFRSGLSVSFAVCVSPGRELRGAVGLNITPAHQRAELGYWMGLPHWGNGYATEAAAAVLAFGFETLQMNRIYAYRFAENEASGRVLEKIGMRHEGRSRQHIRKWDRFIDLENYGMLKSEFPGVKK